MSVLEVAEPAAQRPIEIDDDAGEAVAARAFRLRSDAVLEAGEGLFSGAAAARFEPGAPGLEGLPPRPPPAATGLARRQTHAPVAPAGAQPPPRPPAVF